MNKPKIISESELSQGSPEWLKHRRMGIGSSEIATIMGINPYKTCEELFLEKTGQIEPPDLSDNYNIKRGVALEPIARNLFNSNLGSEFIPVTFVHEDFEFMKFSADGYDFNRHEIIEIKCMGSKNHTKVITENKVLDYYYPQLQWGMMVSETSACYFIAYNPSFPEPMHTIKVNFEQSWADEMMDYAHKFWSRVQEYITLDSSVLRQHQ